MSLEKSQVVSVLDAKPGAEWWRVKDELGRIGYYPSHYLRMVLKLYQKANCITKKWK